jgi:hypothetical protein
LLGPCTKTVQRYAEPANANLRHQNPPARGPFRTL